MRGPVGRVRCQRFPTGLLGPVAAVEGFVHASRPESPDGQGEASHAPRLTGWWTQPTRRREGCVPLTDSLLPFIHDRFVVRDSVSGISYTGETTYARCGSASPFVSPRLSPRRPASLVGRHLNRRVPGQGAVRLPGPAHGSGCLAGFWRFMAKDITIRVRIRIEPLAHGQDNRPQRHVDIHERCATRAQSAAYPRHRRPRQGQGVHRNGGGDERQSAAQARSPRTPVDRRSSGRAGRVLGASDARGGPRRH